MRRRDDLLDEQAEVAERVRKLEIMDHSRTLIPKAWRPDNPELDIIAAHVIVAAGLKPNLGPLGVRVPPQALYIEERMIRRMESVSGFWDFLVLAGVAPRYTLLDALPIGGVTIFNVETPGSRPCWTAGPFDVQWVLVATGQQNADGDLYLQGATPPGSAPLDYMDSYGDQYVDGTTWPAIQDGGFYNGNWLNADAREYATGGMPAPEPCVPDGVDITGKGRKPEGDEHFYNIPVTNFGCEENPIHPQGSSGFVAASYFTVDNAAVTLMFPPLRMDALAIIGGFNLDRGISGPEAPPQDLAFSGGYAALRTRIDDLLFGPTTHFPEVVDWYGECIAEANQHLATRERQGWQTLPLYPGWFGRIEVQYAGRFVTLRGFVRGSADASPSFAAWPNHLPIGNRGAGTILRAETDTGAPLLVRLDHYFRTESPTDYLDGYGSALQLLGSSDGAPAYSDSTVIVFDGTQFGVYEGPFDHLRLA